MTDKVFTIQLSDERLDRLIDLCEESFELSRGALKAMTEPSDREDAEMVALDMDFVTSLRSFLIHCRKRNAPTESTYQGLVREQILADLGGYWSEMSEHEDADVQKKTSVADRVKDFYIYQVARMEKVI